MFLPIIFNSVNDRTMLAGKLLSATCSHYRYLDGTGDLLVYEYDCTRSKVLVACDIVILSNSGEMFMHDYLLLNDGNWRNSFGEVSETLEALLPSSSLCAELLVRRNIDEFRVRGANV
jgi:hypothetical protein